MKSITFTAMLLVISLTAQADSHRREPAAQLYPKNFLWGAALSAHQAEGLSGGGENGNWYKFEHSLKPNIENGDNADIAADFWNRYEEDLQIGKKMGLNTLRTSLAWEKIEPSAGVFSTDAINHYHSIFQRMHDLGMRPMIALHHFVNPQWFDDRGGWISPDAPKMFLEYATFVVAQLSDVCDLWITFNEPVVYVDMAYLAGMIPPQMSGLDNAFEAAFELARAHRMVAAMVHQKQGLSRNRPGGPIKGVGMVNSLQIYDPFDPESSDDQRAAQTLADLSNWDFIRGVAGNGMKFDIPAEVPGGHSFDRAFPAQDMAPGSGPALDWIGVNYYTQWLIRYNLQSGVHAEWVVPDLPKDDSGGAIYPAGLERILRQTADHFPGIPLILSENGLADGKDTHRPQFIRDHLASLDGAVFGSKQGPALDVRGYYHWSLMDNFEWTSGYKYQFGLVQILRDDHLKRVPRPSAQTFTDEILKRSPARKHWW